MLQARTNSSRLPGKALLRLGGIESAVLAALRARNAGHRVVLATSDERTDDVLAQCAFANGIEVFRGDLHDVRSRFVELSRNLRDDDVVVRLTADNVFPDGALVELAVKALLESGGYLVRSMEDPRLPYGLAVEAFRASSLRGSLSDSSSEAKEHVTPPLIRQQNSFEAFVPVTADLSGLRCTLDTAEDFGLLQSVFSGVREPATAGWQELVGRLVEVSGWNSGVSQ